MFACMENFFLGWLGLGLQVYILAVVGVAHIFYYYDIYEASLICHF